MSARSNTTVVGIRFGCALEPASFPPPPPHHRVSQFKIRGATQKRRGQASRGSAAQAARTDWNAGPQGGKLSLLMARFNFTVDHGESKLKRAFTNPNGGCASFH
jgi:hypothetical protein